MSETKEKRRPKIQTPKPVTWKEASSFSLKYIMGLKDIIKTGDNL
jgi:hypothetical protein